MKGIIFALLAGTFFACYQLSIKLSATYIQEMMGAVILQTVAVVVGVIVFFITFKGGETNFAFSKTGLRFAILAGVFVSFAEILSFYAFSQKLAPSVGITLIVGMNILVGLILDYFWFNSGLGATQWIGVILVFLGVILISWENG